MTEIEVVFLCFVVGSISCAAGYGAGALSRGTKLTEQMNRVASLEHMVLSAMDFLIRIKRVFRYTNCQEKDYIIQEVDRILKDIPPSWSPMFRKEE